MPKRKRIKTVIRRVSLLFFILVLLIATLLGGCRAFRAGEEFLYPRKYSTAVQYWAKEYDVDPLLIYAFIRTESGFDPQAESNVGARGLMQITDETFQWIKSKIAADEDLSFEDLYKADVNIRFGAYYVAQCLARYDGDVSTAAAAYHSGWGTVDRLLTTEGYSTDGKTLCVFPYTQMQNYVVKIQRHYEKYQNLYQTDGLETTF